jgi:hypothetical protein
VRDDPLYRVFIEDQHDIFGDDLFPYLVGDEFETAYDFMCLVVKCFSEDPS